MFVLRVIDREARLALFGDEALRVLALQFVVAMRRGLDENVEALLLGL